MRSFWLDRPTLVTGATGLVGGWVVRELLARGADVVCLVRDGVPRSELVRSGAIDRVTSVRGDVRDTELVERVLVERSIDTVIHLAAQAIVPAAGDGPRSTFDSNVRGTWNLLEACRNAPWVKQIVVASSDKAYGAHEELPYRETTPLRPHHPYDVSKACADLVAQSYAVTYDLPVAITRCGNFFGGGDLNWSRLIPGTIRAALRGERPVVRSDGKSSRDYFYVEDGARAYLMLAEKLASRPELRGHAFNFSTDENLTVLEVVSRVLARLDPTLTPDVQRTERGEIAHQRLSSDKARTMLDWAPAFSFDAGLQRTIDWYRRHLGASS
jgi:CDP-glucose 4,6-dehydratase